MIIAPKQTLPLMDLSKKISMTLNNKGKFVNQPDICKAIREIAADFKLIL